MKSEKEIKKIFLNAYTIIAVEIANIDTPNDKMFVWERRLDELLLLYSSIFDVTVQKADKWLYGNIEELN